MSHLMRFCRSPPFRPPSFELHPQPQPEKNSVPRTRARLCGALLIMLVAQGLSPSPARAAWPSGGGLLATDLAGRGQCASAPDGLGGQILAWKADHGATSDIYAQRVDTSGTALWDPGGVPVCAVDGKQQFPAIVPDGSGGAIIAWEDYRAGATADIYVQRVSNLGVPQWASDGTLLCAASGDQRYPAIASDSLGGAIVTWWDHRGASYDIYARRVTSDGIPQWTKDGVALCTAAGDQVAPSIVSDGTSGAIVAWADSRGPSSDIYAQRVAGDGTPGWTPDGVALCAAPGDQQAPRLVSDRAGGAVVAWTDYRGASADVYVQRVAAVGTRQWSADGVALCAASGNQLSPALVGDGAGGAIVAWEDYRAGATSDIYACRIDGSGVPQWTADGVALCTATKSQVAPVLTPDGAGGAVGAWSDYRGGATADIYACRITGTGVPQWTSGGVLLCGAAGDQLLPGIVPVGTGGAIVAWEDHRAALADLYARRVDGGGVGRWASNGTLLCTAVKVDQVYPAVTSDMAGGAIVVWEERFGDQSDIYGQRIDRNGVLQWGASGVPVCAARGFQYGPVIVSDGAGGAIVAWYDNRDGSASDIYAQRLNAAGVAQWNSNGVALCTAGGWQGSPVIASDGAGGAIVAWEDQSGGAAKVYAQRVSGAGVPLWTANGVGLCMVGGDQNHLAIAPDLAGGAIVAWEDGRGGSAGSDIYARRVDGSGNPQWSSNGVAVCTVAGDQRAPVIVSDAAGGAIVGWVDYRSTYEPHIYARLVSGAGVPQWAADGVALCSAPGGQSGPALVTDGAGGAIAAWLDDRDGLASDIYAQRVSGAGSPLWPTDGVALCTAADFRDSPALVPDGAGGAIAAWSDYRSGYSDIYERRVTAAGATRHPT